MTRSESGRVIGRWGPAVTPEFDVRPPRNDAGEQRRQPPLQAPWGADADEGPHHEAQVEAAAVDEESFQDVRVASQVRASHRAGLVEMRIRALQALATAPLQGAPTGAANTSTVGVHGV